MNIDCQSQKKRRNSIRVPFSSEEDNKLLEIIQNSIKSQSKIKANGEEKLINWKTVSNEMEGRTVRQCKERYLHYLSPLINKSEWTNEEDILLVSSVTEYGKKWKVLEKIFKNRTEIDIRNRYHVLQRRISKVIRSNLSKTDVSMENSANVILNVKEIYFDVIKPHRHSHSTASNFSNKNSIDDSDDELTNNNLSDDVICENNNDNNDHNFNTEKTEDIFYKIPDISIDERKGVDSKKKLLLYFNGCVYDNYYINDSTF